MVDQPTPHPSRGSFFSSTCLARRHFSLQVLKFAAPVVRVEAPILPVVSHVSDAFPHTFGLTFQFLLIFPFPDVTAAL